MTDIENEFRHFNDVHRHEAETLMAEKGWSKGDRYYEDFLHDHLTALFEKKIQERFELLLTERPMERMQVLKNLVARLRNELEDYCVERHAVEAIENLILLRMLEPEAERACRVADAFERYHQKYVASSQPQVEYVYNRIGKGKVHIFRGHWRQYIDNPSYPAPCDHYKHRIFFGCEQPGFSFTTAPYKTKDYSQDYVVVPTVPNLRELCKSCEKANREGTLRPWPDLSDWELV